MYIFIRSEKRDGKRGRKSRVTTRESACGSKISRTTGTRVEERLQLLATSVDFAGDAGIE